MLQHSETDITLGVRRSLNKAGDVAALERKNAIAARDWPALREQVLKRDRFACTYCGFTAKKFQRVHFKDGEPTILAAKNLATACIFCEQCFELESVGRLHSGALIWLPELQQIELNHLARALYVTRTHKDHAVGTSAQTLIDQLVARRTEAKKRLGTDDPMQLATAMIEQMNDKAYARRAETLAGIRLMPLAKRVTSSGTGDRDQFQQIIDYWRSDDGPFADASPDHILELGRVLAA